MKFFRLSLLPQIREHFQHRFHSVPDLPGRYYRSLVIGGGVAVSIAVLAATIVWATMLVEQYLDERKHVFLVQLDHVTASVDRYQARLRQMAEAYELLWHLHDQDQVPVELYRQRLQQNQGVVITEPDLTVTPFAMFSSLDKFEDDAQLGMFLRLMRETSPIPILRQRDVGHYLGGFIYSSDRRFLATWPPIPSEQIDKVRAEGIGPFVGNYISRVEAAMSRLSPEDLRKRGVVWVPLYSLPVSGELVAHYAVPLYRNDQRIAVIVITIPFRKFPQLFEHSHHESGFFILSHDRLHLYGVDERNTRESNWAKSILRSVAALEHIGTDPEITHHGNMFFLSQFIPGPNWIAIYATDWYTVFLALQNQLGLLMLLTFTVLTVQWIFIVLLDRLVLAPLRARSRLVYESEAFNRAVLTTAPVGLTVYDPSSDSVVMQNDATQNLLASSLEGNGLYQRLIAGRSWSRPHNLPDSSSETNEVRTAEISVSTINGQRRDISAAFSQARYQQREVVLFGLTDISDQKNTVRLLQRAREAADEANQAKSMFLAMMSHEIRTPLHGALGNLELLAMEKLTPRQRERVSTIHRAFDALLALINDILDLSKMEAQELQLHNEPFRLDELIERCAQTFAPVILDKNLRFLCLIDPRLTGSWSGDGHRLTQVLMNLLSNARKFTESGSITLRAMQRESREGSRWVRISVSDTGIGISSERLEKVFEPFVQADRSISSRYGGTGLGLTLCSRIMALMGGNINADSEEGEGSIFTVNVPLHHDSPVDNFPLTPDRYDFATVVIVCDAPLWQLTLVDQIKHWLPEVVVIEAQSNKALAAENEHTVMVFATLGPALPEVWSEVQYTYLDTVIVSGNGSLYPERQNGALYVTAFSASMFKLALAACGKQEDSFEQEASTPRSSKIHHETRILIAEDDPLNRTLLEHQLAALGYNQYDSVGDGQEALKLCLASTYDVIVTDLGMPIMDGHTLLKELRARGIETPVIVSTAETGGPIKIKTSGFAEVLHKPITIERLNTALEQVLDKLNLSAKKAPREMPNTLALTDMQALFLAGWNSDESALLEALYADDSNRFLGRLHRLKGALLALGENSMAEACGGLRQQIDAQGMKQARVRIDELMEQLRRLVSSYPC
ncbi:ATP-binding protein [Aeromonas caviae]|uniref:ATP-binding protein n=1 Tax=Aeromonas caviae TaxID=648 RepID=UPI0029D7B955|nr:ATP-binding protein [Aeromonas caviae]MDX7871215.1 ATP-binding protein [Aeromonas caviae]